jgi:hypothetical protein
MNGLEGFGRELDRGNQRNLARLSVAAKGFLPHH